MKNPNPPSTNKTFNDKLKTYSALGAAFLAAVPAAEATIIYHNPPDIVLTTTATTGIFATSAIGLNIDGNSFLSGSLSQIAANSGMDVAFNNVVWNYGSIGYIQQPAWAGAWVYNSTNQLAGSLTGNPLPLGYTIGLGNFVSYQFFLGYASYGFSGFSNWGSAWFPQPITGYLGVKFDIGGNVHFGWVQLQLDYNVNLPASVSSTITILDYAYENVPNTPIPAGATSSGPAPVPTLSEWGLINLGLMLLTMGTLFIRRVRKTLGLQVEEVES